MKRRTNKKYEVGTVGAEVLACLDKHGFDSTNANANPTRKFFEGFEGRLYARIRVTGERATVSFGGTGVKKDRTMDYFLEDLPKFESRIKRLVRVANEEANYHHRSEARRDTSYNITLEKLVANGIERSIIRMSDYRSSAIFVVNGYQLECNENLLIDINVAGNRLKVDVLIAVNLLNSLVFNPDFEEDE